MLTTDLSTLPGLWPALTKSLLKLHLKTVRDFLYYFPRSYEDRRVITPISSLHHQKTQFILGKIVGISERNSPQGTHILTVVIDDGSEKIRAIWFKQKFIVKILKIGLTLLLKGRIEQSIFAGESQFFVTDFDILYTDEDRQLHAGCIVPVYALSQGIYQSQLRKTSQAVFAFIKDRGIEDSLPQFIAQELALMPLKKALHTLHYPFDSDSLQKARERLAFEELFLFQLRLAYRRSVLHQEVEAPIIRRGALTERFLAGLPYTLTAAQQSAIQDVENDFLSGKPMNRLIQGDVGAGKTDVALASLLSTVQSGYVGALMAPTEILAQQHYVKFTALLKPLEVPVLLLKGALKRKNKKALLEQLKYEHTLTQKGFIVVGTHALIEDSVDITGLGLIVVDEQHRFGVMQRMTLASKGSNVPHALFMTATPIPRSFLLTCFGDLDKSVMKDMPAGRIPAKSYFVKEKNEEAIWAHCLTQLQAGRQLYVVYPLIEESEKLDLQSAIEGFTKLQAYFKTLTVGILHGRMAAEEKAETMQRFARAEIHVLVATTVIEVGIDVPNASMMIIYHAERFGLSQLHQLRGRIGRGSHASYCYLIGDDKSDSAKKRLNAILSTTDGFKLAEFDLAIRGPGDLLGTRQAGMPEFKVADLLRDEALMIKAKSMITRLLNQDPLLSQHPILKQRLEEALLFHENQLN